jgi:hypothetical protein
MEQHRLLAHMKVMAQRQVALAELAPEDIDAAIQNLDLRFQGNEDMYTAQMLIKRRAMVNHPLIRSHIEHLWGMLSTELAEHRLNDVQRRRAATRHDQQQQRRLALGNRDRASVAAAAVDTLTSAAEHMVHPGHVNHPKVVLRETFDDGFSRVLHRRDYIVMSVKLQKCISPQADLGDCQRIAMADWVHDTLGVATARFSGAQQASISGGNASAAGGVGSGIGGGDGGGACSPGVDKGSASRAMTGINGANTGCHEFARNSMGGGAENVPVAPGCTLDAERSVGGNDISPNCKNNNNNNSNHNNSSSNNNNKNNNNNNRNNNGNTDDGVDGGSRKSSSSADAKTSILTSNTDTSEHFVSKDDQRNDSSSSSSSSSRARREALLSAADETICAAEHIPTEMTYEQFHQSMFELVDVWVDTADASAYVALLERVEKIMSMPLSAVHFNPKFLSGLHVELDLHSDFEKPASDMLTLADALQWAVLDVHAQHAYYGADAVDAVQHRSARWQTVPATPGECICTNHPRSYFIYEVPARLSHHGPVERPVWLLRGPLNGMGEVRSIVVNRARTADGVQVLHNLNGRVFFYTVWVCAHVYVLVCARAGVRACVHVLACVHMCTCLVIWFRRRRITPRLLHLGRAPLHPVTSCVLPALVVCRRALKCPCPARHVLFTRVSTGSPCQSGSIATATNGNPCPPHWAFPSPARRCVVPNGPTRHPLPCQ